MPDTPPTTQIIAFQPTTTNRGYWVVFSDGSIFAFGDAIYVGRPVWDGTKWTVV